MGFERVEEFEFELAEECPIALELFEYRVDQYGFTRRLVGEQIGVGRCLWVDELRKITWPPARGRTAASTWVPINNIQN